MEYKPLYQAGFKDIEENDLNETKDVKNEGDEKIKFSNFINKLKNTRLEIRKKLINIMSWLDS